MVDRERYASPTCLKRLPSSGTACASLAIVCSVDVDPVDPCMFRDGGCGKAEATRRLFPVKLFRPCVEMDRIDSWLPDLQVAPGLEGPLAWLVEASDPERFVLKRSDLRCCNIVGNTCATPCAAASAGAEDAGALKFPPMNFARFGRADCPPPAPRVVYDGAETVAETVGVPFVEAVLVTAAVVAADVAAPLVIEGPEVLEVGEEQAGGALPSAPPTRPVCVCSDVLSLFSAPPSSDNNPVFSLDVTAEAPEHEGAGEDPRPAADSPLPTGRLKELEPVGD